MDSGKKPMKKAVVEQRGKKRRAVELQEKTRNEGGARGMRASPLRRLSSKEVSTPQASSVKPFVQGEMTESIKHMMYGFGDEWEPDSDSVELMEEITIEYIRSMTKKALELSLIKGKLDADCLLFLVRKHPKKLERIKQLLAANELLKNVLNSGFDPMEENGISPKTMEGRRVQDTEGHRGTIRFTGTIDGKGEHTYYGIEWDEENRGKHNGEANGKRYFTTKAATSGSFVVPSKVSTGVSLLQALEERYMQAEIKDIREAGQVATASGNSKSIQLVGVHKIQEKQDIGVICKVSLESCQISQLPQRNELHAVAPNIEVLNLAWNLLNSWNQVLVLAEELPKLEELVLSGNRLCYDVEDMSIVFPNVKSLVLNDMNMTWSEIHRVCHNHFPNLKELYAVSNGIDDSQLSEKESQWFAALELIDLSHNSISNWSAVEASLGSISSLKHLILNGNQVEAILPTSSFTSLATLAISDNKIALWSSVDALNTFPALELLRFIKNPLVGNLGAGESRMIIVARCERLAAFNGSEIRAKERVDAEQMYLKRILHELASFSSEEDKQKVLSNHPRYSQLLNKYPDLQKTTASTGGPAALSRSLVAVVFVPMSINATTMDNMEKKIPLNMKVAQLKLLVQKKYGLEPAEHQLSFRNSKKGMPIPMDDDSCEVAYYGLQDGNEILINDA
ncbi:tubulin-specific chaperone E [Thraustotheca clavata]|uniref:Transcription initiation factor TFIID subunit 13 n=1 Tax=Thraustotheca clavata TaxID=74557 RepID=A0A1V9ZA31_9STRA|nr:tubulin-specific chaperone E [Thraustotheca clavata]